jgi:alkaline phosphatase D
MRDPRGYHMRRRDLLGGIGAALVGCSRPSSREEARVGSPGTPELPWGVQTGDVGSTRALIWARADRASRLVVQWSTSERFDDARRFVGPLATEATDLTAKITVEGLPAGTRIHYRAAFEGERLSEWTRGSFRTAPGEKDARDVVLAWSGDTNGQGWGIDDARGGMPAYAALLERAPDLFVHCGDRIYADDPIPATIALPDGTVWRNLVTRAKAHRAETLDDFRGAFLYSRESSQVRALSARVPLFSIWDDHEVRNDWWPGQSPKIDELARHARRALFEHTPTLHGAEGPMYRSVKWGPLLELFLLDGRSHRTQNDPPPTYAASLLGDAQVAWLESGLARSTATWKIVACDMPIGLVVSESNGEGGEAYDGFANIDGPPRERELELARLLTALKKRGVKNIVWLTADVHYAAAHRYDPARAAYKDFDGFWEFVAGPMHATSFPRKPLDDTFGPEVVYASAGSSTLGSPATGAQSFGVVRIDGKTGVMTVTLVDARGRDLFASELQPAPER